MLLAVDARSPHLIRGRARKPGTAVVQVFDLDGGPGTASDVLAGGVIPLRPHEHVFEAMPTGWRNQQLARRLAFDTVAGRERAVRAFCEHVGEFPWAWSAQHLDEWMTDLRAVRGCGPRRCAAIRRPFGCSASTPPTRPTSGRRHAGTGREPPGPDRARVEHDRPRPGRRVRPIPAGLHPTTEAFFDHADGEVTAIRDRGRKGWLPAFRDATLFKVAYAYGLRRNEVRMLDVTDFGPNPHASEFAGAGVCYVRYGKASKGFPPKRRSVLTVWPWTVEVLTEWTQELLPTWNSRRATRQRVPAGTGRCGRPNAVTGSPWRRSTTGSPPTATLSVWRPGLDFHCLRRS